MVNGAYLLFIALFYLPRRPKVLNCKSLMHPDILTVMPAAVWWLALQSGQHWVPHFESLACPIWLSVRHLKTLHLVKQCHSFCKMHKILYIVKGFDNIKQRVQLWISCLCSFFKLPKFPFNMFIYNDGKWAFWLNSDKPTDFFMPCRSKTVLNNIPARQPVSMDGQIQLILSKFFCQSKQSAFRCNLTQRFKTKRKVRTKFTSFNSTVMLFSN